MTNLLDTAFTGLLHEEETHDDVVVEEAAGVVAIGPDSADDGREVNHDVRPVVVEEGADGGLFGEVVVGLSRRDEQSGVGCCDTGPDIPAEETAASGDQNPSGRQVTHVARPLPFNCK